jgi:FMN reductase
MSTVRKLAVVSAGVGVPSSSRLLADRLAQATIAKLHESGVGAELANVELRDHAMDIARNLIQGFASPSLEDAIETVTSTDGAIFVTPIYSAGYSGLFKSFLDVLDPESIDGLPVIIAATAGTERHSLALDYALRPVFTYLRAVVVPTGVFAATSDWGSTGDAAASDMPARIDRAAAQLAALVGGSDRSQRARDPSRLAVA